MGSILNGINTSNLYHVVARTFKALYPAQIALALIPTFAGLSSTLIVANFFSSDALAALGIINPVNYLFEGFGCVLSAGLSIVAGNYLGRGDYDKTLSAYATAIKFALVLSGIFLILAFALSGIILGVLGATTEIMALCQSYYFAFILGIVPSVLNPVFIVMLSLRGNTKFVTRTAVVIVISNIAMSLCAAFFGDGNLFYMGLAYSLSQYVGLICFFVKLGKMGSLKELKAGKARLGFLKEMLSLGMPSSFNWFFASIKIAIMNRALLAIVGLSAVSAFSVFNSVVLIFTATLDGSTATILMLSSVASGERDKTLFEGILKIFTKLSLPINFVSAVLFFLLAEPIGFVFGLTGTEADMLVLFVRTFALTFCFDLVCDTLLAICSSLGRSKFVSVMYLFIMVIFPLAICLVAVSLNSVVLVALSPFISTVLSLIALYAVSCVKNGSRARTLLDLIWLGNEYDAPMSSRFSLVVKEQKDAVNISEQITKFCLEKGIDRRRSNHAGLCVEELAVSIVERGMERGTEHGAGRGKVHDVNRGTGHGVGRGVGRGVERSTEQGAARGKVHDVNRGTGHGVGRGTEQGVGRGVERSTEHGAGRGMERGVECGKVHDVNRGMGRGTGRAAASSAMDILITVTQQEVRIRVSDTADAFNPVERQELYQLDPADPMANVGIRIVSKIAKEMSYKRLLNVNVLTIEL